MAKKKPEKSKKRRRDINVSIWVDEDERALIASAASAAEDLTSTWARKNLLRAAREQTEAA